ncbi:DMT family transporter [Thermophilibacter sp. ET337]|uniref:DMT family transporter n=1 Tax=Thermophilibacter sp. ET337 TaxID=2973084 RepID=UPI0021AC9D48|nr:DMT family transporter [Thermophilibacter sp. ET337]MCR8907063.1 DMT family transporter [Thermophilibacter sp. ET337]
MARKSAGRFVAAAFLAACLYALSTPCSKVLLGNVAPNMMAALLYLGAGAGMAVLTGARAVARRATSEEIPLERADAPYVVAMVLLDVAAPILLMAGLAHAAPENVALLNNFEIVATAVIAFAAFRERVAPRTWAGIAVITASCALLSLEGAGALSFSSGSLLVLGACLCWGVENNCTSRLSEKDPAQVVVVKGFGSGAGALAVALLAGDALPALPDAAAALLLGFVAYGLSIFFYVYAQRGLGAARTSAYYAVNPFIGAALSLALFQTVPGPMFLTALALMALGAWLVTPRAE